MSVNRVQMWENLPDRLKKIGNALVEMNEVITGGQFEFDQVWGAQAVDQISTYMNGLQPAPDLKSQIDTLLKGLPASSTVNSAVTTVLTGVQKAVDDIFKINDELGTGARLDAFKRLNAAHPAGDYTPEGTQGFGLFPAIEGVINSSFDTNVDLDNYLDPIKKVAAVAAASTAILNFVDFAAGSLVLLQNALKIPA